MNNVRTLAEAIKTTGYSGSGILVGKSDDASSLITACFICGRDELETNRRFVEEGGGVMIQPVGERAEPSLIYQPVLTFENKVLLGNGTQLENIYADIAMGQSFGKTVKEQTGIDNGMFTEPRITAYIDMSETDFDVDMRITKALREDGTGITRQSFKYSGILPGTGYLMTMFANGEQFTGEPVCVETGCSIFDVVADIWENLEADKRVSLWVRSADMKSHKYISRIINRNR